VRELIINLQPTNPKGKGVNAMIPKTSKRGRHAGTGRFIPVKKAIKLKDRAVVETVKRSKCNKH